MKPLLNRGFTRHTARNFGLALLVLVQDRRWVGSALFAAVFVIGPMWLAPREQLLELRHNWWQVIACLSYVLVGLAYLIFFALNR